MRLRTSLAVLALSLFVGVAVLAVNLRNGISLGFATSYLEAQSTELLGRRVSFKDAPRIQIKSGLHIAATNVSLADADWSSDDDMLILQSITAHIDLATLLEEQIVLETLTIDGLQLRLRKSVDGLSNLPQISSDEPEVEKKDQQHLLPVVIKRIQVSKVLIDRTNDATEQTVSLVIDSLSQQANSKNGLLRQGSGSLQGRPWSLTSEGSGFNSLRSGLDMSARFTAKLGDLELKGDFHLPDAREIQNLTVNAQLDGPVPDRIAALSPLLEPDEPAQVVLHVRDIEPGLRLDLQIELTHLNLQVNGDIDNPKSSDGLDLAVQLNAASLPRLAEALGLGETTDVPLTLEGRLLRKGKHIELRDAVLVAGDHHVQADVVIPSFPGTDGATVNFSAIGPDFAWYQRLLGHSPTLEDPYTLTAEVVSSATGGETLKGNLSVGGHQVELSGVLNNFPSYAGSDLKIQFDSPSLEAITANAGIALPVDTPISLTAALSVSENAVIDINSAKIAAFDFTSHLSGKLNGYPDFDNADLRFTSEGASLAALGQRFGINTLGSLPLSFSTDIQGSPQELVVSNFRLDTGGLELQTSSGALGYANNQVTSDLRLSVVLSNLNELLGTYAPAYSPAGSYRFDLLPQLSASLFSLGLENLSGPGVSGSARIELANDFRLNEKTLLTADLKLEDLSQLLPSINEYTPPKEHLFLRLVTRPGKDATHIDAQLLDTKSELLTAGIDLPADLEQQGISVVIKGAGDDLRKLGTHTRFPDQKIPFVIDLSATAQGKTLAVQAQTFQLGDTHVHGVANWDSANKSLTADLKVPRAQLQAWLPKDSETETTVASAPAAADGRKIPGTTLPLELLHDYRIDLSLETGPLGLVDPKFDAQSLVDESKLRLQSGDGKGQLHIEKIVGSRGSSQADLVIDDVQGPAHIQSEINVSGMPLGIIAAGTNFDSLPTYDLTAEFTANGDDLRAIAATLDGDFLLKGSSGTLQKMKLSAATESFIAQVFRTLLPMLTTGNTNMQVQCSVLAARATNGVLTLDPGFVFRSEQVDLSAQGEIDLRNEKLGIRFTNRARKGLGISAASLINPYVEITGTLSKPTLGLDIASSAISGGAAVATGGITLLAKPLFERFLQKGNPCDAALERWQEIAN